jgi:hypothetical protein
MARIARYQPNCPQCQVGDRVRRKGRYLRAGDGFFRLACTRCKITFTRFIPQEVGKCGDIPPRSPRKLPNQGEAHPQAKLTAAQVRDIVALYDSGSYAEDLAEQFGVSKPTIRSIIDGSSWGSVTGREPRNPKLPPRYKQRGR